MVVVFGFGRENKTTNRAIKQHQGPGVFLGLGRKQILDRGLRKTRRTHHCRSEHSWVHGTVEAVERGACRNFSQVPQDWGRNLNLSPAGNAYTYRAGNAHTCRAGNAYTCRGKKTSIDANVMSWVLRLLNIRDELRIYPRLGTPTYAVEIPKRSQKQCHGQRGCIL